MHMFSFVLLAVSTAIFVYVRRNNLVEWLVRYCAEAEMTYGTGTGYLKLRDVYAEFVDAYPILSAIMPFGVFSALVDKALKLLKEKLSENKAISDIVIG